MRSEVESVIRQLAEVEISKLLPFGSEFSDTLFTIGKRAIVKYKEKYWLLLPKDSNKNEEFMLLTELFSYLRYMEESHILYVKESEHPVDILIQGLNDKHFNSVTQNYDLGNGCLLSYGEDQLSIICRDNPKYNLSESEDISLLTAEIEHYLLGYVYPTASLRDFIQHGYLSSSDYQSKSAISISRISIVVAIAIALLSPILTVFIGNRYGKTTIVQHQFDTLMRLGKPTLEERDSNHNVQPCTKQQLWQPLRN